MVKFSVPFSHSLSVKEDELNKNEYCMVLETFGDNPFIREKCFFHAKEKEYIKKLKLYHNRLIQQAKNFNREFHSKVLK